MEKSRSFSTVKMISDNVPVDGCCRVKVTLIVRVLIASPSDRDNDNVLLPPFQCQCAKIKERNLLIRPKGQQNNPVLATEILYKFIIC